MSQITQSDQNTEAIHPTSSAPISKVRIQQREIEPGIILVHPTPKTLTHAQSIIPRIEFNKNNDKQQIISTTQREIIKGT